MPAVQASAAQLTHYIQFAESGAAYHVDITGGVSQLAIQQAWWRDCFMNEAFLAQFPRLKLIMQFGAVDVVQQTFVQSLPASCSQSIRRQKATVASMIYVIIVSSTILRLHQLSRPI